MTWTASSPKSCAYYGFFDLQALDLTRVLGAQGFWEPKGSGSPRVRGAQGFWESWMLRVLVGVVGGTVHASGGLASKLSTSLWSDWLPAKTKRVQDLK